MSQTRHRYVPAAGRTAFTRLYDPAVALTMRERTWRPRLRSMIIAPLPRGGAVVDVGAGTGTFAIALAAARPDAAVIAVDGDEQALALARAKFGAERVEWRAGLAGALPVEAGWADAVVMSLLLHHLDPAAKTEALTEAARVLRPGGRLHVADWGRPQDPLMRGAFLVLQALDGFSNTRDHAAGRLPEIITAGGFAEVAIECRMRTTWGSLELLSAGA
jgi:ubiquinone/menaquinone biosynthesis C-methylase UbiE